MSQRCPVVPNLDKPGPTRPYVSRRGFLKTGIGALAARAVPGCDPVPTWAEPADPRLTARPGEPTIAPTIGLSERNLNYDRAFLDSALEHTFERCRIDAARIAFAGFSDGASFSLSLGVSNGDLFSNLVGHSPGFSNPSPPLVGEPRIFVSHGRQDRIVSVAMSRDVIVPGLRRAGYDVVYREFTGGHSVPAEISEEALDWFLA